MKVWGAKPTAYALNSTKRVKAARGCRSRCNPVHYWTGLFFADIFWDLKKGLLTLTNPVLYGKRIAPFGKAKGQVSPLRALHNREAIKQD